MTSARLHGLAQALRNNPALVDLIAKRLDDLAEDVARLEAAPVPDFMRCPVALPDGVISLAAHRRKQA